MIGQTLGHYRILEKIGAGGMGEVYRAHDQRLDRDVALKVLSGGTLGDEAARRRFRKEALALSKLNHPSIATIFDFDTQDGVDFLVMEHIAGVTLAEKLAAGPLPEQEVARLGSQVAAALEEAHEQGVVHRDLKPGNIKVTPKGHVKVLDFGLARLLKSFSETATTETLTETQAVAGTLPYMAPEQLRGRPADPRSDLWALGVVLYEAATGVRPFQTDSGAELSAAILRERPRPWPPQVPAELQLVIERCLEKEPARRYQRAGEVRAALEAIQTGAVAPWAAWRYRLARRPGLALAATIMMLLAGLVALNVGGLRQRLLGSSTPQIQSLAVLPLENLSGDSTQDYFADGMTEALITDLAQLAGLKRVIARGSVMRYKGTNKPLPEIARELKVDALITGSVLRAGERVRVSAQLIDPATEAQLWGEGYERDLRDVLALQSEVTQAIANQIRLKLTPAERTRLAAARPVNPEAYDAYLKGRFHWQNLSRQELDTAQKYFQLALEKDPNYALAHLGVGTVWALRCNMGVAPCSETLPKWKEAVRGWSYGRRCCRDAKGIGIRPPQFYPPSPG